MSINLSNSAVWIGVLMIATVVVAPRSGVAADDVVRKVERRVAPIYPAIAKQMRLSGTVKMVVLIGPDGKVKSVRTTGGHPILVEAAEGAVKQWRFEAAAKESSEALAIDFTEPTK